MLQEFAVDVEPAVKKKNINSSLMLTDQQPCQSDHLTDVNLLSSKEIPKQALPDDKEMLSLLFGFSVYLLCFVYGVVK